MALAKAATLMASAALEVASLIWMELAMFAAAALVYVLCVGGLHVPQFGKWLSQKKTASTEDEDEAPGSTIKPSARDSAMLQEHLARGDHHEVFRCWQRMKTLESAPSVDLTSVIDSMRKLGRSTSDVVAELRSAVDCSPGFLTSVASLPASLVRDDNVELLDGTLRLLAEHGSPVDSTVYAGLMNGQLRRRDFSGVAETAKLVKPDAFTPKMRAMLAAAAAHRGRLDEALGQLRQMPAPLEGARSALTPAAAAQILNLATREQRIPATAAELQRVRARLDQKHLDELITFASKKGAGASSCKELVEAGSMLQVQKGPGGYQAIASTLAAAGDVAGVRGLLSDLEAETSHGSSGVAVGEPLALAILEAVKIVKDADLVTRALELHRTACAGAPSAKVLSAVCAAFLACDRSEAACDFYERAMAPKSIWPDSSLTHSLLKAAAQAGRSTLAKRLSDHVGSMRNLSQGSNGHGNADLSRHATMIKAYAREGDLNGASNVFAKLQASGTQLTPMIYNCYLDACAQCGNLEGATDHFEEMKRLNVVDVVGYNTMLKAYLARGLTKEAQDLMNDMTERGLQANKVTYNELLHAKVTTKDRYGLWDLVKKMHEAGVHANSVTCSILLKSLTMNSPAADVKRIVDLIDEVEEPIDEVLFSSVIEACIRIRQLNLLSDLMRRYRKKGGFVNLTAPTYGSMIKAYGQAGDVLRVQELWHEMEEHNVKPTAITLGCMTEALVTNGQSDEAWELIHSQLNSEERRGCINTVIYSTVLKGFAVARRMDKVFSVYKEMRSKSIPCNTITYNTMLDACAKCCAMDRASNLLEDMKESCVEPDIITYSTIVKGYCVEGDVDRAFHVLEEMKSDEKFLPDEIMYNSILDGCSKQHRVDDALRVLEEMKSAGVSPSNYTLSILVKLLGHARRLNQAFRMVDDLSTQNSFRPNVQVYTCLVQACVLNRRLERALALHDTMVADAGCWTDDKFYAVLARGCLQLHHPMKAVEVVRAAYLLPCSLSHPVRKDARPVGVEARALEEVVSKLQAGGKEEQDALAKLSADLFEMHNLRLEELHSHNSGMGGGRRGGGGGGRDRGRRGGANRNDRYGK